MEPLGSGIHCISLLSSIQQHALKVSQICSNANELHHQTSSAVEGYDISRGLMHLRAAMDSLCLTWQFKTTQIYRQGENVYISLCGSL